DLVAIDNRRVACRITKHLLGQGAQVLIFFRRPHSAQTVGNRARGFLDACPNGEIVDGDPCDRELVRRMMEAHKPDGIVCATDVTAANLMRTLEILGHRIPESVRVTGIDDVRYASLLPVPLTTMRQPCAEIGTMAMQTMLSRIEKPDLPARDILLDCKLVIR